MPYAYQIENVLNILRTFVVGVFAAQGAAVTEIPYTVALEQYPFDPTTLPLTVFEIGSIPVGRDAGDNTIYLELPVTIHHGRSRVDGQLADMVALSRLGAIGTAMENDYRLSTIADAPLVPIHTAEPKHIMVGDDSKMQVLLNMENQGVGLCAVSMLVNICWYEGKY